jgi:UDP-glucuronate 4-epimerase
MRVMVTGAAGFIGSHLVRELDRSGVPVVGVDCFLADSYDPAVKRDVGARLAELPNVTMVEADIRDPLPASTWSGVTAVVNLAAMPGLIKSWDDFDLYQSCNLTGVHRLLEGAMSAGIDHFIQISTSSVYGSLATGSEEDPLRPISPYGVTKLAGERLTAAYGASFGVPYSALRYFSVFGPGQRPDMAYHIVCEKLLDDEPITIFGDGLQSRSNTYVHDIVRATVLALEAGPTNETMNIAGGETISLLDAVRILEDELGRSARLEFAAARPGDQRHTQGNTEKAERLLGYRAAMPVEEGLRLQAQWHRSRRA